jgi:hypothetical protein
MQKVWNITDHPGSEVAPSTLMLFGKRVLPGRYVKVEDAQLKNAHKTAKDVKAGLIHIGDKLPDTYTAAKGMVHARLPQGHARAHGAPVKAKAAKVVVSETKAAPKFKKMVTEKPVPPPPEKNGKGKKTGK